MTKVGPLPRPRRTARPLLQVEKLTKFFPIRRGWLGSTQLVRAVDGVSLYVRHAETLAIVGESGCGKTTLARAMLRLIEPTFGRIVFDGQDLTPLHQAELRPLRRQMQILFQDPLSALNPRMTAREILDEVLQVHQPATPRSARRDRMASLLVSVGLQSGLLDRFPHELSSGERQRIAVARALALAPRFLICDDSLFGLDVATQALVVNRLLELQEQEQLSMLFISNDLDVVAYVSHRVGVMYLGRIVELAPTPMLLAAPRHPYTATLVDAADRVAGHRRGGLALAGEPPSPLAPPPGCGLHPRCPRMVAGLCDIEEPQLQELEPDTHHRVACHNPLDST